MWGGGGSTTKTTRNFENFVLWFVFSVFFVERLKIKNEFKT